MPLVRCHTQAKPSCKQSVETIRFLDEQILTKVLGLAAVAIFKSGFAELIEIRGDAEVSKVDTSKRYNIVTHC